MEGYDRLAKEMAKDCQAKFRTQSSRVRELRVSESMPVWQSVTAWRSQRAVAMADVELSAPSPTEKPDILSRFYNKNDEITFESILADVKAEATKPTQSKMTDFCKPDRKKKDVQTKKPSNTSMILKEILKSAEKRLVNQSPMLSPVQEEFLEADIGERSPNDVVEEYEMPVLDF